MAMLCGCLGSRVTLILNQSRPRIASSLKIVVVASEKPLPALGDIFVRSAGHCFVQARQCFVSPVQIMQGAVNEQTMLSPKFCCCRGLQLRTHVRQQACGAFNRRCCMFEKVGLGGHGISMCEENRQVDSLQQLASSASQDPFAQARMPVAACDQKLCFRRRCVSKEGSGDGLA